MGGDDDAATVFLPVAPKRGKAQQMDTETSQVEVNDQEQSKDATNQTLSFTVAPQKDQIGLTKDELQAYVNDPFWIRTRWALFILFWLIWTVMFITAIVIVVVSPKCPVKPSRQWWEKQVCCQIWTPGYSDSNDDGVGDINGIKLHLPDMVDMGVQTIRLAEFMLSNGSSSAAVLSHTQLSQSAGTWENFDDLISSAHNRGMKVVIELPLSTSTWHSWFTAYDSSDSRFNKYYNFDNVPNNMQSLIEKSPNGKPYAAVEGQTDAAYLNVDVPEVQEEIVKALRFWIKHGVDGFYLSHIVPLQALIGKELNAFFEKLHQEAEVTSPGNVAFFSKIDAHESSFRIRPTIVGAGKLNSVSIDMLSTVDSRCGPGCWYAMLQKEKEYFHSKNTSSLFWQLSDMEAGRLFSRMKQENRSEAVVFVFMTLPGSVSFLYGEELGLDGPTALSMCWKDAVNGGFSNKASIPSASNCPTKSLQRQAQNPKSYYSNFAALAKYRIRSDALLYGNFDVRLTSSHCIVIARESTLATESLVTVVNLADRQCSANYHTDMKLEGVGDARLAFSTSNVDTTAISVINPGKDEELVLQPYQAVIFKFYRK